MKSAGKSQKNTNERFCVDGFLPTNQLLNWKKLQLTPNIELNILKKDFTDIKKTLSQKFKN